MASPGASPLHVAARLRSALERAAQALAEANLDGLLAAEVDIESALSGVPDRSLVGPGDRAALLADIDASRSALTRCERLGASLTHFVRTSLDVQGRGAGYRTSSDTAATLSGRSISTKV